MVFGTDLTGKMAVAIGAGGILCGMFARILTGVGASVALLDINLEAAEKVAGEIRDIGGIVSVYEVDAMDKDTLESVHARILAELGPCDILVNGVEDSQTCTNTPKEYFEMSGIEGDVVTFFDLEYGGIQKVLDLNSLGVFLTCQVFAKDTVGRDGCNILNIPSASAKRPLTRIPILSEAVAALSNFTQWLAVHFVRVGTRVNAIAPGFFVTRQDERFLYEEDDASAARAAKVSAVTPIGRFGKPEELNGALLFLFNNEAAGFITGVVLPMDGRFGANAGVQHACSVTYVLSYIP